MEESERKKGFVSAVKHVSLDFGARECERVGGRESLDMMSNFELEIHVEKG